MDREREFAPSLGIAPRRCPQCDFELTPQAPLTKDRLILVEGSDEKSLFWKIIMDLGLEASIQVINVVGQSQFPAKLGAVLNDAEANSVEVKCLAFVRDAHDSAKAAFESICYALKQRKLPVPDAPGQMKAPIVGLAGPNPYVTIHILPDNVNVGSLEDLCWQSVRTSPAGTCCQAYLDCLKTKELMQSNSEAKTLVHTFLASTREPTTRVGLGAIKNCWHLDDPAFDMIKALIRQVATVA